MSRKPSKLGSLRELQRAFAAVHQEHVQEQYTIAAFDRHNPQEVPARDLHNPELRLVAHEHVVDCEDDKKHAFAEVEAPDVADYFVGVFVDPAWLNDPKSGRSRDICIAAGIGEEPFPGTYAELAPPPGEMLDDETFFDRVIVTHDSDLEGYVIPMAAAPIPILDTKDNSYHELWAAVWSTSDATWAPDSITVVYASSLAVIHYSSRLDSEIAYGARERLAFPTWGVLRHAVPRTFGNAGNAEIVSAFGQRLHTVKAHLTHRNAEDSDGDKVSTYRLDIDAVIEELGASPRAVDVMLPTRHCGGYVETRAGHLLSEILQGQRMINVWCDEGGLSIVLDDYEGHRDAWINAICTGESKRRTATVTPGTTSTGQRRARRPPPVSTH